MKTLKRFSDKPAGVINPSDLKTFKGQFVYWLFMAILIILSIICLVPAIWTLCTGFKTSQEIYQSASFFPKSLSWETVKQNIAEAWFYMDGTRTSINTLIISVAGTVVCVLVDGFGGYVLSRLKPKGTKLVFILIVWTMMIPGQIRMVPLYISYMNWPFVVDTSWQVNLLNTYWPMILMAATSAFTVILFKNSFDAVSISLVEAAKLDGAGDLQIFFKIMIPLSMPIVIFTAIGTMRGPWGDFFNPFLILQDATKWTMPVSIFSMQTDPKVKMNIYMLALIISSVPGLLIFALFQKYIMGGINVGGVKG